MKIFFVRHGVSADHEAGKQQHPDCELSELGKKQAHFIGKRFSHIAIDTGIYSPYCRTRQTAEAIQEHVPIPFESNDAFREWDWPSSLLGMDFHSKSTIDLKKKITQKRLRNPDYIYENEESFNQLKLRLKQMKQQLEALHKSEAVIVISHEIIIKAFLGFLYYGQSFSMTEQQQIRHFFTIHNTGIVEFEVKSDNWQLIAWNDHAHL